MRACMVAPTKIIAGLGMSLGIDLLDAPGTTGDYRTQFHAKAEKLSEALISGQYDFGFLHIKAVDDTGHDQQPVLKVQYLECVDVMIKQLVRRLHQAEAGGQGHYSVCVTGDHSTPVLFGDHSHEPVPFTLAHVCHVVSPPLTFTCLLTSSQQYYALSCCLAIHLSGPVMWQHVLSDGFVASSRCLHALFVTNG
ncbi:TPA: hypothetical protein ACH3X1_001278 [Trebouxia sp. C0004]